MTAFRATAGIYRLSATNRAGAERAVPGRTASVASLDTWIAGALYGSRNRSAFSGPIPGARAGAGNHQGPVRGLPAKLVIFPRINRLKRQPGDENGPILAA